MYSNFYLYFCFVDDQIVTANKMGFIESNLLRNFIVCDYFFF